MQPTTMAMLMILDRVPDETQLQAAFARAVAAVPRLAQRVAETPLDIALPHWENDPTFDLAYHVRRHTLSRTRDMDELFREIAPVYESPFDRSRPLWEARVYDGLQTGGRSALFFKLHHAVADGVGANAIFAAMTDDVRETITGRDSRMSPPIKGTWPEPPALATQLVDAVRDRMDLVAAQVSTVAGVVAETVQHPERLGSALQIMRSIVETVRFDSHSPLKRKSGRARRLTGTDLPFAAVRAARRALGGSMIDVILTIVARAIGTWYAKHRVTGVRELMTLVPVNLRKPEEWAQKAHIGNVATGILVPIPIRSRRMLAMYREIHKRMEAKKADPLSTLSPVIAELLSMMPRGLVTWMAEASFGSVDLIVTNVPGILTPRYLADAEIEAAYPFAPVAVKSPVSVALYGYRDRLFVGLTSDETAMPDVDTFGQMIREAFKELCAAAGVERATAGRRPAATPHRG